MTTITLIDPWTYVTPERSIDYPAGKHQVAKEIAEAAEAAGVTKEGKAHGGRTADEGQAGAASDPEE